MRLAAPAISAAIPASTSGWSGDDLLVTHVDRECPPVRAGWRVVKIGDASVADLIRALPGRSHGAAETDRRSGAPEHAAGTNATGDSGRLVNVEAWRVAADAVARSIRIEVSMSPLKTAADSRSALSLERARGSGAARHGWKPADDVRAGGGNEEADAGWRHRWRHRLQRLDGGGRRAVPVGGGRVPRRRTGSSSTCAATLAGWPR